jgi:hypothetical protein
MKMNKIVENQIRIYKTNFLENGDSPEGTYNQNSAIQNLRFERLLYSFDLNEFNSFSIHDIGCGICDILGYLKDNNYQFSYSGTDIITEMKQLADNKYPGIKYYIRDILEGEVLDKYDFLVLSGTFNLPGQTGFNDWKIFTREIISKMFFMANCAISFNFLSKNADYFHKDMYYEDPNEVLNFCLQNLSRFVIIDHSYALHEFTVTVFKQEFMKNKISSVELKRFFK